MKTCQSSTSACAEALAEEQGEPDRVRKRKKWWSV